MEKTKTLAEIQRELKAPKGQFNKFGNYKFRSCEDILEALKPIINPWGYFVRFEDEIQLIGDRYYVKTTCILSNGANTYASTGLAREEESQKGMQAAQITGACSSYARKYALNALFAIDDTKDADATNDHGKVDQPVQEKATKVKLAVGDENYKRVVKAIADRTRTIEDARRVYEIPTEVQTSIFKDVEEAIRKKTSETPAPTEEKKGGKK